MSENNVVNGKEVKVRELNKKVSWMSVGYESVNSEEYWKFRKEKGMTHCDYVVMLGGKKGLVKKEEIVSWLVKEYIEKKWKEGDIERQVAQYLGQLTEKGWNGLMNKIIKVVEGKK